MKEQVNIKIIAVSKSGKYFKSVNFYNNNRTEGTNFLS